MWKVSLVAFFLLLSISSFIDAAPDADEIKVLPGYGVPPSPQWSGFLDAGKGTKLHYWMAAAEGDDWTTKPVVLWLNGGPGSSSLLGMLQEQGPLLFGKAIDENHEVGDSSAADNEPKKLLFKNPYAWTKLANLVAVESPAGVGYSYCKESLDGKPCHNDDISTAKDLHAALQDMFATKFPELIQQDFFITGESYAGVYCPTLAKEILDANDDPATETKINLVGMAVGDPCTDNESQEKSMDMLWYGHKYGFVPDDEFDLLYHKCGARYTHALGQSVWSVEKGEKSFLKTPPVKFQTITTSTSRRLGSGDDTSRTSLDLVSDECKLAHRKFLMQTSRGFSQEWKHGFLNDLTLYGPFAIVGSDQKGTLNYRISQWMMSDEVKEALHVTDSPATEWPGPSDGWTYASNYTACNEEPTDSRSMIDFYREIAPRVKGTVLVYNGDTDPCVTYEGTRVAIERVGFDQIPGGSYRPWFYNATADSCELLNEKDILFGPSLSLQAAGPQFAGHVVDYEHGLSFCTVHGSGHMVPQFRPRAAFRMLSGVLTNTRLSPEMATNRELLEMKESEYDDYLDQWSDGAKVWSDVTAPYN